MQHCNCLHPSFRDWRGLAKPYDDPFGRLEYLSHHVDLGALFHDITLVDADCIDPQQTSKLSLTKLEHGIKQVLSNGKVSIVANDYPIAAVNGLHEESSIALPSLRQRRERWRVLQVDYL